MDTAYDTGRVGQVLERLAQERIDNPYAMLHLSEMTNEPNWATKYEPLHCGVPAAWRLIQQGPGGIEDRSNKEEVVVAIQGIVAKKDLPPFEEKVSTNSTHAQFLRQSVTLVGFHTPTFAKAVTNALELHAFLGRSVGHNNLEQCGIVGSYMDQPTIEVSNRYFTPIKQAPSAQEYPFSPDVDPKGYLAAAAGRTLAHIEDNIIQYYEMTTNYAGDTKFTCAKPIKVQVGDIVEVQVSIILVPLRGEKYKSTMILRSLMILDGSFTQASQRQAVMQCLQNTQIRTAQPVCTIKRRVGYADEELSVTRMKLSKMQVDESGQVVEVDNISHTEKDLD